MRTTVVLPEVTNCIGRLRRSWSVANDVAGGQAFDLSGFWVGIPRGTNTGLPVDFFAIAQVDDGDEVGVGVSVQFAITCSHSFLALLQPRKKHGVEDACRGQSPSNLRVRSVLRKYDQFSPVTHECVDKKAIQAFLVF